MHSVICLDPGNSTGWVFQDKDGNMYGGTLGADHLQVYNLIRGFKPDIIVYETFQLYPSRAQKMAWNSFYPCEVIGVIKLYAMQKECHLVGLQPSVKKYTRTPDFTGYNIFDKVTEHTRDAWRLYEYFKKNKNGQYL